MPKKINLKRKTIISIVIMIIGALICTGILALLSVRANLKEKLGVTNEMLTRYTEYMDYQQSHYNELKALDSEMMKRSSALTASVLRTKEDIDVGLYDDGCVFRYDGKNAEFPDGLPADMPTANIHPQSDLESFVDDSSMLENESYSVYQFATAKIKDDLYYLEWKLMWRIKDNYMSDELSSKIDWLELFDNLASTYDIDTMNIIDFEDGTYSILTGTGPFARYNTLDEIGLTGETIEKSFGDEFVPVNLDLGSYYIHSVENESLSTILVALIPFSSFVSGIKSLLLAFVSVLLILCITLIVWLIWNWRALIRHEMPSDEIDKFSPSSMKKKVAVYIAVCCLVVGIACSFAQVLSDIFYESRYSLKALENIESSISIGEEGSEVIWQSSKDEFISDAKKIASLLDQNPELRTKNWLQEASDIIGADYIMLFDVNGDELLSNARYKSLSLGTNESSSTYDFRRLLKGVNSISHENVTEEVTGLTRDMYGISLKYVGNEKAYGALIIAVNPENRLSANLTDINATLQAHSIGEHISYAADPETGIIKYCNVDTFIESDVCSMGLGKENLKDSFLGFYSMDYIRLFGRSEEIDGLLYYFNFKQNKLFASLWDNATTCISMFLVIAVLLCLVLLHGYDSDTFKLFVDENMSVPKPDAEVSLKEPRRIVKLRDALGITGSPFRMAMMTLLILASAALLIVTRLTLIGANTASDSSVVRYIMEGDWDRGLNIFSIAAVLFTAAMTAIVIVFMYLIRILLKSILDSRGMTICSLVTSILQYVTAAAGIFVSLGYLGVDYKAILASVGIFSMAVSFGAKDLVADIFAGINLLANNTYQMGDVVEIGGYRGTVQEINLRTTKVLGTGGNVKTIRNNSIGDVINLSKQNSWYPSMITISSDLDINALESMLDEELPKIRERNPIIVSGPQYNGIDSMGGGKINLLILTECHQADYSQVQRVVNKEIHDLFEKNDIKIL